MDILIDATSIVDKITGVSRYAIEIIKEILKLDDDNFYIIILNKKISKKNEIYEIISKNRNASFEILNVKGIGILRELKFLYFKIFKLKKYDVFHSLSSNAPFVFKHNNIVTIHDLKFILYPQYIGKFKKLKSEYIKFQFRNAVRNYSRILTVSESTKSDLLDCFKKYNKSLSKKTVVVYNSYNLYKKEIMEINKKYNITKKYFLYIGELRPHKNVEGLIKAFDLLQKKYNLKDLELVIGGKKHDSFMSNNSDINNLNFIGFVDDNDLYTLYNSSIAYCLISFYEGFGIPILEAMASETAVITSNNSSMPEVAGESCIIVDPNDIQEIAESMYKLYSDKQLRQEYINNGLNRVKDFSWSKSAIKTLEIYNTFKD